VSAWARYGIASITVIALAALLLWPFLGPSGRRGVLVAAAVAVPLQIASFALLCRFRGELKRFLLVWVGGTVIRMLAIGAVAFLVLREGTDGVVPTLLALATFFFGLLLLEPVYFRPEEPAPVGTER
jgi:hypothetical protein